MNQTHETHPQKTAKPASIIKPTNREPREANPYLPTDSQAETNVTCVVSLALGVLGFLLASGFNLFFAIATVVVAIIGIVQAVVKDQRGIGFGIAAILVGILNFIIGYTYWSNVFSIFRFW